MEFQVLSSEVVYYCIVCGDGYVGGMMKDVKWTTAACKSYYFLVDSRVRARGILIMGV